MANRSKNLRIAESWKPSEIETKAVEKASQRKGGKLIVGSIFPDCEPLSQNWLDLQLRYLKATTDDFHHVSIIQRGEIKSIFCDSTEVIRIDGPVLTNSAAHSKGLEYLKNHFIKVRNEFEFFLFLDMDAFPIRVNWRQILINQMGDHEIAVALRPENLEQRLHSSILFCKRSALEHLRWSVRMVGRDLNGDKEMDVTLDPYQEERRQKAFVLLRSNMREIHPLLCGVYYDLFYHHGCGSGRAFNMRSRSYWKHIVSQTVDVMTTIENLFSDPNEFIGNLANWPESNYGKV
jgi:hypothetical protein